jgi:hypothetical protein
MSYNYLEYDNDIDPRGEHDFSIWKERSVVADCLSELGYKQLASFTLKPSVEHNFVQDCINVIKQEANARKDYELIDRLAFAGLIYS